MEIVCKNGEKVNIEEGEEFLPKHVKDFEDALNECGLVEQAIVSYPEKGGLPQGLIAVFEHKDSGMKIATENNMSSEVIIAVAKSDDELLDRVRRWLDEDKDELGDEVIEYMMNELETKLGKK